MSKEWKVGDRVQRSEWVDGKEVFHTGAIARVTTAQREKHNWGGYYGRSTPKEMETYVESIDVQWDDGKSDLNQKTWFVVPEDNEYEREFRLAMQPATARIEEKLALASKYLDEAVAISEETGVPFSTGISFLHQSYRPNSTGEKFPEVDNEFIREVSECYNEYEGWEHSAVC